MRKQRENLRVYFETRPNQWLPLPEIMQFAAQYNSRLLELRRSGMCILNKTETQDGIKHSWYKYIPSGQMELF